MVITHEGNTINHEHNSQLMCVVPESTDTPAQKAFEKAKDLWKSNASTDGSTHASEKTKGANIDSEKLDVAFKSARASQKQDSVKTNRGSMHDESVRQAKGYTEADIHRWLLQVRLRKDKKGKPLIK